VGDAELGRVRLDSGRGTPGDRGFLVDPLSAVMMLVVSFVGFLIHVYSIGYMHGDPGYARFFTYLNLFMTSMLVLVLANNYLLMFLAGRAWASVPICSSASGTRRSLRRTPARRRSW